MTVRTGVLQRALIVLVGCFALGAACGSRALALAEYCPAEIGQLHQLEATTGSSALIAYALHAEGPRSVAGSVVFDTSMGWFVADFPTTPLTARAYHMQDEFVTFTRTTFESDPLYVRFPQALTLKGAYISKATSSDDHLFGWDAKGTVQCAPRAGFEVQSTASPQPCFLKTLNPRTDLYATPSPNALIAAAAVTSTPGSTNCDVPFANATVVSPASPDYPQLERERNLAGAVWVEVAVNGDGTLADASIYAPSGSRDFDEAALRAARLSKYEGGRVFCQPAGANYLFQAVFSP